MGRVKLTDQQLQAALINPYYAIDLDAAFFGPHEHTIDEASWIEVNKQLLKELGPDAYLRHQLDVLKGRPAVGDAKV
jgi:hypothetical protein